MLSEQDYASLEHALSATQEKFEQGELTEFQLRRAFEPIAALTDAKALESLREWAAQSPRSYVANLALGLNYRVQGSKARGTKYWEKTAPEQREAMVRDFALAEPALRKSITLTSRPYLSLLNLMKIAGNVQARPVLNAILLLANEALPANQLARLNYARYLLPRWGGSYDKFDAFVAFNREQGVAEGTLLKLQAIELNDRGMVQLAAHSDADADALFRQALQLGRQSGDEGGFRTAFLAASVKHVCKQEVDEPACQPPVPVASAEAPAAIPIVSGRLGDDIEHPVVVTAADEFEGIRTEYAWLALRYPAARRTSQALIHQSSREYDVLAVTTSDGRELRLYFDITAFYGRMGEPRRSAQAQAVSPRN